MILKFESRRHIFIVGLLWIVCIALVVCLSVVWLNLPAKASVGSLLFPCFAIGLVCGFLLSILFHTGYAIEYGELKAFTGPMR